jgi:hypothetical protein
VAHQPAVVRHRAPSLRVNARHPESNRLRQRKLRVAQRSHRRQRRRLLIAQADARIHSQKAMLQMVKMDGNILRVGRILTSASHSTMLRSMACARSCTALVRSARPKSMIAVAPAHRRRNRSKADSKHADRCASTAASAPATAAATPHETAQAVPALRSQQFAHGRMLQPAPGAPPDSDPSPRGILRGKDRKARHQRPRLAFAARQIPPPQMQPRQRRPAEYARAPTCETASTRAHPHKGPLPPALHALRMSTRRARSPFLPKSSQTRAAPALHAPADGHEAMLLKQSLPVAHRPMMALDEHRPPVLTTLAAENGRGLLRQFRSARRNRELLQQRAHLGQASAAPSQVHQRCRPIRASSLLRSFKFAPLRQYRIL